MLTIAYYDAIEARKKQVMSLLQQVSRSTRSLDSLATRATDVDVLLVGLEALQPSLQELARLTAEQPHREVILLWEGAEQGLLLAAMRAGVRDVVSSSQAVNEALQRVRSRKAQEAGHARGHLISIFSFKGGCGKSLLAANLPIALARMSQLSATVVDLAVPAGHLGMYLDLHAPRNVVDVLALGGELDDEALKQALVRHDSGISVLTGAKSEQIEGFHGASAKRLLALLRQEPGLVIADVGTFALDPHVEMLQASDVVLVPVSSLISNVSTLPASVAYLEGLGVRRERILPLMNHTQPHGERLPDELLERLFGGSLRHELPWAGAEMSQALNAGQPLALSRPRHPFSVALDQLASELLERLGVPAPSRAAARDWRLGNLFDFRQLKGAAHVRT